MTENAHHLAEHARHLRHGKSFRHGCHVCVPDEQREERRDMTTDDGWVTREGDDEWIETDGRYPDGSNKRLKLQFDADDNVRYLYDDGTVITAVEMEARLEELRESRRRNSRAIANSRRIYGAGVTVNDAIRREAPRERDRDAGIKRVLGFDPERDDADDVAEWIRLGREQLGL